MIIASKRISSFDILLYSALAVRSLTSYSSVFALNCFNQIAFAFIANAKKDFIQDFLHGRVYFIRLIGSGAVAALLMLSTVIILIDRYALIDSFAGKRMVRLPTDSSKNAAPAVAAVHITRKQSFSRDSQGNAPFFFLVSPPLLAEGVSSLKVEEQARTLGIGRLKTMLFVTLPGVRSGIIVTGVFCFIGSWSVYLLNNVIGDPHFKTLPVVIFPLVSVGSNSYSTIAVAIIVYILPVLAILALTSKALADSPGSVRKGGII